MQEMDDLFNILKKCMVMNLNRKDNLLSETKELRNVILENKDEADEWKDAKHEDFSQVFYY